MKVIYAFKDYNGYHYKPIDDRFFELARTSVNLANKFYKTEFYCDDNSRDLFDKHNVSFNSIHVLDSIENYNGPITSMSKILAMMEQEEPYMMLDFDTLIFQEIPRTHTIQYAYGEMTNLHYNDMMNYDMNEYLKHLNDFYKVHYHKYKDKFPSNFKLSDSFSPNHSVVMVENPVLIKQIYQEVFTIFSKEEIDSFSPMFLEQFLLFHYIHNLDVDFKFIQNDPFVNFSSKEESINIIKHKFLHWLEYHKCKNFGTKIKKIQSLFSLTNKTNTI